MTVQRPVISLGASWLLLIAGPHGDSLSTVTPGSYHILVIYLFIFRDRGREGEREGEKH